MDYGKRKGIAWFLIAIVLMLLVGCQEAPPVTDPTQATQPTTQPTASTPPGEDPAVASLKILRFTTEKSCVFAAAYFGYDELWDPEGPRDAWDLMERNTPQLVAQYPFLMAIPEENMVGSDGGDLFCIVPRDPKSRVRISQCGLDLDQPVYDTVIYESDKGDPVLLFCNNAGVDPDTQVVITDPAGNVTVWYPTLGSNQSLQQISGDDGLPVIRDFTAYREVLASGFADCRSNGWVSVDTEMLEDTTWGGFYIGSAGSEITCQVTFHADHTADILWEDDGEHSYGGAAWTLFERNGYCVLSIDLGGLAGIREYNVLMEQELGLLYVIRDVSDGEVTPASEPMRRILNRTDATGFAPEDMIGSWDRIRTEFEGYSEESIPGICAVSVYQDAEGFLRISYTDQDFPDKNFYDRILTVSQGELYYGCGNDRWLADVDHVGPWDTTYAVTLLDDGTLLLQFYWEVDGQRCASYSWFARK